MAKRLAKEHIIKKMAVYTPVDGQTTKCMGRVNLHGQRVQPKVTPMKDNGNMENATAKVHTRTRMATFIQAHGGMTLWMERESISVLCKSRLVVLGVRSCQHPWHH